MTVRTWQLENCHEHMEWLHELRELFAGAQTTANKTLWKEDPRYAPIIKEVEEIVGLPLTELRGVCIPNGQDIPPHDHKTSRLYVYMLMDHNALLSFPDSGESVETKEGQLVEVYEGAVHWVSQADEDRYTMAFMFDV